MRLSGCTEFMRLMSENVELSDPDPPPYCIPYLRDYR